MLARVCVPNFLVIHNIAVDRQQCRRPLFDPDLSSFLCSIFDYIAYNGCEKLEFDFGENALETAITSKEGSRCANYSIGYTGDSEKK
jgi:hypothetical protein